MKRLTKGIRCIALLFAAMLPLSAAAQVPGIQSDWNRIDSAEEVRTSHSRIETGPRTHLPAKSYSTALKTERRTLQLITDAYGETMPRSEFHRILPSEGREGVLEAPFGARAIDGEALPRTIDPSTPTFARRYALDSSLTRLMEWYRERYGFNFNIRRSMLTGSFSGDTLTVAYAVMQQGNEIFSVMIWNPAVKGGRKKRLARNLTYVSVEEWKFRSRSALLAEGPDAVVELTWDVPYSDLIQRISAKYQIDPHLVAALVQQESGFNPKALSVDSAMGLTQMIPTTAAMMGVSNPNDPEESLDGGVRYLKLLLKRFKGNVELALAAYNAGPGNVDKYNGIPPFSETREYVKRIMARYREKSLGTAFAPRPETHS